MMAFMPFSYFFKADLVFITIGTIIGIIGSSAFGVTNSLLVIELISLNLRKAYFSFFNIISIPFFLVIAPIMAFISQAYGLSILFQLLTAILVAVIAILLIACVTLKKEIV